MLERINFYDGGVVTLAKNLSDQGKSISEIFEEINIRFPNLGTGVAGKGRAGGSQGKPSDKSGVSNILKKNYHQKFIKNDTDLKGLLKKQ